jgi:hypothetical protein
MFDLLFTYNEISKTEEEKFYSFKLSIERLHKVMFNKFKHYYNEIAIEVFEEIVQYYPKFKNDPKFIDKPEYHEHIKYIADWIVRNKHNQIDDYFLPRLIEIYNKYIK